MSGIRTCLTKLTCAMVLTAFAVACTEAEPGTPTASDELSPGRTVNPTPATAGDTLDGDAVTRWCEQLGDQESEAPAIVLYRRAREFGDSALAQAAATLSDPSSSSHAAEDAYQAVAGVCSSRGVELPAASK